MVLGEDNAEVLPSIHEFHRERTVCITGAAGFIGSWLVMRLLERGYTVRATVRDTEDPVKTKHLLDLPGANERLILYKADMDDEGSFDAAIDGCEGVFHLATRTVFESRDPENEVIRPTVNGLLNVMRACAKAKSVKRVVFTSSVGAMKFTDDYGNPGKIYDETCWTNVELCTRLKITGWIYFASKTLAERAAWEFAEKNNIDLIPPLVVGPFISQTMPPSMKTALALLTRNEPHYAILRQVHLVHLDIQKRREDTSLLQMKQLLSNWPKCWLRNIQNTIYLPSSRMRMNPCRLCHFQQKSYLTWASSSSTQRKRCLMGPFSAAGRMDCCREKGLRLNSQVANSDEKPKLDNVLFKGLPLRYHVIDS